jgi:hypothetical protein
MKSRTSLYVVIAVAMGWWFATPAWSQMVERGRFDINVGGGVIQHPNSSALQSISPNLNLKGRVFLSESFGVGFTLDYSRTETDDDIFPLAQFNFGTADSTLFVAIKQPVAVFQYQAIGTLGTSLGDGGIYPYLQGGIGAYTIYLDPQQNEAPIRETNLLVSLGGAVKFHISGSSSLELSVYDYIWTDFDREKLNPTLDRTCRESGEKQFRGTVCPNERFPFLDPALSDPDFSAPESTIHNIVLTASFSFIPRL